MADKKPPVGKDAESDGQNKVKKSSTKKKTAPRKKAAPKKKAAPRKKAAPKKKVAPKKKRAAEKKPVPKKQAAKKQATATESTGRSSIKPPQTDKTVTSATKTEVKTPVQTDTQPPPLTKPDRVGKKTTVWPWITLFALVGITAYLLGGPLREQNDPGPSAVMQENQENSATSLGNAQENEVEPLSPYPTGALIQGGDENISQESKQSYATPITASDVVADPDKLSEHAINKSSADETMAVQDSMEHGHAAESKEATPEKATFVTEHLVQETPSGNPPPISTEALAKPVQSNSGTSRPTNIEQQQVHTERNDQNLLPPGHGADPSILTNPVQETVSSLHDSLNNSPPPVKPEVEDTVQVGQADGPSAEVSHTQRIADHKSQTKHTAEPSNISAEASLSETPDEVSQVASSQAETQPRGVIGMPIPEASNKPHPADFRGSYWRRRWGQHVPRQYLPAFSYSPYYHNYYRQRTPLPAYRLRSPYHPQYSRENDN